MTRRSILFLLFLFSLGRVYATHNRAGEITYKWIGSTPSELKYEITITTYTKTSGGSLAADRPSLDSVYLGDSPTPVQFLRDNFVDLPIDVRINTYKKVHTYVGPGEFLIRFVDPNRNADVINIPHSVVEPFYIESLLKINPFLGPNSSPIMTYPPLDQGCVNRIFEHDPAAHDADGDRLSYELVQCGGANQQPIIGYSYPAASNYISIDSVSGMLTWDSPMQHGEYNVAFHIKQYRKYQGSEYLVGYVRRDMQIIIKDCDNYPPEIDPVADTCVLAGDTLSFVVRAEDPDNDIVDLTAFGGIMDGNIVPGPATFTPIVANNFVVTSRLTWATTCDHIRSQPYFAQFRAADRQPSGLPPLVDLETVFIRVIAPGPPSLNAVPNGSSIDLVWAPAPCANLVHYNVYRKSGQLTSPIDCPCTNGVPAATGFSLIGTTPSVQTTFTDDNNGQGLTIGIEYCYLITAVYSDSSESCASPQACASLKKDAPVITHADVRHTSTTNGSVFVGWSKPTELDTIAFPPPYEYRVYRSDGFFGANFGSTPIAQLSDINDTSFVDSLIDTKSHPWSYMIELWYTDTVFKYKGRTATASTIFLSIDPTDNALNLTWEEHVTWTNLYYDIFKKNISNTFDSIATVTTPFYTDTGLINGNEYCYYIRSNGSYFFSGFVDPIINRSQEACEIPFDNVEPCLNGLVVNSDCENSFNFLTWSNPNNSCADDVLKYYIYFSPSGGDNYELLDSVLIPTDTNYLHDGLSRLSGCYKVYASDSVGNLTENPLEVCVDTCREYVLPSVFTPDADGVNDFFHPCDSTTHLEFQQKNCPPYKNVKSVDMKIYNRWGNLVYETTDKDVNWDGNHKDTKGECPEGVYFYTCKVFFFSIKGEQTIELNGTIQLIRN